MKFDPKKYEIKIHSFINDINNKIMFCGRVTELKTVYVEETTPNKAYETVIKEIKILKDHYDENNIEMPLPLIDQDFSGELRLRLGPELHKEVAIEASKKGLSINKLIIKKIKVA